MYPKAIARIYGGKDYPQLSGTVRFFLGIDGVIVEVEVKGLPETESGFFGFHIHAGSSCTGEGFVDTGSHYNPERISTRSTQEICHRYCLMMGKLI